jgi:hypothetical protein
MLCFDVSVHRLQTEVNLRSIFLALFISAEERIFDDVITDIIRRTVVVQDEQHTLTTGEIVAVEAPLVTVMIILEMSHRPCFAA